MTGTRANFRVAIPMVLFFLVVGIVVWVAIPVDLSVGQHILVGVCVLLAPLLLALVFRGLFAKQRREQRVMAEGILGTAQVLGMTQTGLNVNEQPQVELHMRVEAPAIAPYELREKFIVPLIALGQLSGGRLSVAIDRENHENVVVNWGQPPGGQAPAPWIVSTQDGRTFDVGADPELHRQAFAILGKHGLGTSGELDLREHPQARAEVLALLESKGHDVDPVTPGTPAAAQPAAPAQPAKAADPAQRLEELRELKEKGLVSEAEYESKRIQVISEL